MEEQIGIIYSPNYGAGWSPWNGEELALDQTLAHMLNRNASKNDIESYCKTMYPDAYLGGLEDCIVEWVNKGTLFRIEEYDGSESLILDGQDTWQVAL